MASRASGRKPDKVLFHWKESLIEAGFELALILFGRGSAIGIICLFLDLTAVHYAPQNWIYWLQWTVMTVNGVYVEVDSLAKNAYKPPCLSRQEKSAAVQADAGDVSGWYGPGAYLAWLFTVYVSSMSSIWHADYDDSDDDEKPDHGTIDGELLAALTYPTIAILDMLYRFIRCKVDPTFDAAMLVIFIGTFSIDLAKRLASPPDLDKWIEIAEFFPSGPRQWMLSIFLLLGHSVIFETMWEPYNKRAMLVTVYALALVSVLHSTVRVERYRDRFPYHVRKEKRPRWERIAVFLALHTIFWIVVATTRKSVFPRTGSSLSDLDQCATLLTVVVATVFARRTKIGDWVQQARIRLAGFRPILSYTAGV